MDTSQENIDETHSPLPTEVIHARNFSLTVNVHDILLSLGQTAIGISRTNNQPVMGADWTTTISFSPTAARQLVNALNGALSDYETKFGSIPRDPVAQLTKIDLTST